MGSVPISSFQQIFPIPVECCGGWRMSLVPSSKHIYSLFLNCVVEHGQTNISNSCRVLWGVENVPGFDCSSRHLYSQFLNLVVEYGQCPYISSFQQIFPIPVECCGGWRMSTDFYVSCASTQMLPARATHTFVKNLIFDKYFVSPTYFPFVSEEKKKLSCCQKPITHSRDTRI